MTQAVKSIVGFDFLPVTICSNEKADRCDVTIHWFTGIQILMLKLFVQHCEVSR